MGWITALELFKSKGITYDDYLVRPADLITFTTDDVNLETHLTKNIILKFGFVASPMDTVMNAKVGILMDSYGGIGCVHFNQGKGDKKINNMIKEINEIKDAKIDMAKFPDATLDKDGRPRALAAIDSYFPSVETARILYMETKVDAIIVDTSMISSYELQIIGKIKEKISGLEIIAGNVCHDGQIRAPVKYFGKNTPDMIAAWRVGVGPGQTCDLQQKQRTGCPNASSVFDCAYTLNDLRKEIEGLEGYVIADGGIYLPGHVFGSMTIGATTAMAGTVIGTREEAPGKRGEDGKKEMRGMGSKEGK